MDLAADDAFALDCPLCGTSRGLRKQVNAELDEIWVCVACPAVLFTYHTPAQLDTLAAQLDPGA